MRDQRTCLQHVLRTSSRGERAFDTFLRLVNSSNKQDSPEEECRFIVSVLKGAALVSVKKKLRSCTSMSAGESALVDERAATKQVNHSVKAVIAHLPQVYNLTWNDDFFDMIPAAVAVFDLDIHATISPPTLWLFPPWNLCHLALTMNSILVVYKKPAFLLLSPITFCHEGQLECEHIPLDSITEFTLNHDDGIISFLYKNANNDHSQERWIRGLDRPEDFDHALVAIQENFYRHKRVS